MAIDIIFVIVAAWGFYIGYSRGIIKTIFMILSILFGLIVAFRFAPAATDFLRDLFQNDSPLMLFAGFILCFVLTWIIIRMVARFLEGGLKTANINVINQFLGGVLFTGLLVLIYSALLWFADESKIIDKGTKQGSYTYPVLKEVPKHAQSTFKIVKPVVLDFWEYSVDMMDKIQEATEKTESEAEIYDLDEEEENN